MLFIIYKLFFLLLFLFPVGSLKLACFLNRAGKKLHFCSGRWVLRNKLSVLHAKEQCLSWLSRAGIIAEGSILQVCACFRFSSCNLHFGLVRDLSTHYSFVCLLMRAGWMFIALLGWTLVFNHPNWPLLPIASFTASLTFPSPAVCSCHSENRYFSSVPALMDWQGHASLVPRWNESGLIAISSFPLEFHWITFPWGL